MKGREGFDKGDTNAGAPKGNNNREKNRPARDALNRLIKQSNGKELRDVAQALLNRAKEGDVPAAREIFDRTDGKVLTEIGGKDGGPVKVEAILNLTVEEK